MPLDWTPFVDLVRHHHRFLLTTHVRPDGDGLGSMLALANTLQEQGKAVRLVVASVVPPRYDFLDPTCRVQRLQGTGDEFRECDAIVILDTGTWNQLGDFGTLLRTLSVPRAVIDHHVTQDDLGAIRLVDTSAEATGRLVFEAIEAMGSRLSPESAHCLFVAVAMDTGWFRHANTTARTFELAGRLIAAGAKPTTAYESLFEQSSLGRLKLAALVLERLQLDHKGKICHSAIYKSDYMATGAVPQDSEDLINYTRSVAGVEVGLFFMEQPDGGVKVSFRSRSLDVARLAQQFGGGGHQLASGAILQMTLDEARARVLAAVSQALEADRR